MTLSGPECVQASQGLQNESRVLGTRALQRVGYVPREHTRVFRGAKTGVLVAAQSVRRKAESDLQILLVQM